MILSKAGRQNPRYQPSLHPLATIIPAAPSSQPNLSSSARKGEHSNEPFDSLLGDGMIASGKWMGQSMTAVAESSANKHWSGTFIRLRAEVLVLAALIFMNEKIGFQKLPYFGEFLSHAPASQTILFVLLILFAYQLVSWCVRAWLELEESGFPSSYLEDFIQRLTAQLGRADELSQSSIVEIELRNPIGEWESAIADLKDSPRQDLSDYASRIEELLMRYRQKLRDMLPENEHPSFDTTADRVISTVDQLYKQHRQQIQSATEKSVIAGTKLLQEEQRILNDIVKSSGPEIAESFEIIHKHSRTLFIQIRKIRNANTLHKIILEFLAPLLASIALVVFCYSDIINDIPVALSIFMSSSG